MLLTKFQVFLRYL